MVLLLMKRRAGSNSKIRRQSANDNPKHRKDANQTTRLTELIARGSYTRSRNAAAAGQVGAGRIMLRPQMIVPLVLVAMMGPSNLCGQEPAAAQRAPSADSVTPVRKNQTKELMREDGFWDKKNDWGFVGAGAARTLDYFSTLNMRRRGRQEILLTNDAVDNHAAFAAIEA